MEIEELREEKKQNFQNGLIGFLEEYQFAQNNPNNFSRYSDNCGNQARKVSEAFCRYIILNSDKPDGQKINEIKGSLSTLIDKLTRNSNVYIADEREKDILKTRLKRILDIGNDSSHDNSVITTQYDLDEIKNNLVYLADYLFGQNFIDNLISNNTYENTIDSSLEDIDNSDIEINLGKNTTLKNSVKKIKNSNIKIG